MKARYEHKKLSKPLGISGLAQFLVPQYSTTFHYVPDELLNSKFNGLSSTLKLANPYDY